MSGAPRRGTAVITGASRGIGRAIARRLAAEWEVIAVARSAAELDSLRREIEAAGGDCSTVELDVTDAAAVQRALSGLDAEVLVNNAGIGIMKPLLELTVDDWRSMMAVNLDAVFYVTRALLPGMVERGRGHVVNIGSLSGRGAFVGGTGYAATKHALVGFSESLMMEVRDSGVRVSLVMPGSVDTGFSGSKGDASWKLAASDVADAIAYTLQQAGNALVSRVELRPLRKS
ncbi:MAG TPA: SDR family NAD(P)-dependent oxidoreductase [Gemmatimonadaceae bacterium]|nr:SDR family NAD(P)-dependent oxidoreductase [Gemmatimonadaceae bacterium]